MNFIPMKLYVKIEKKLFDRFWENELLNFVKLNFFLNSKFYKNEKKRYILPRNIPTDFEKNPNIGCRVTGVDRWRTTAIGPVDLKRLHRNKTWSTGSAGKRLYPNFAIIGTADSAPSGKVKNPGQKVLLGVLTSLCHSDRTYRDNASPQK